MVVVVAPDAVGAVIDHLGDTLAREWPGIEVWSDVPNPRPERHVRVTRVGGPASTRVTDQPMLLVEAWAPTKTETQRIVNTARAHLSRTGRHVPGLYVTRADEVSGPADDPDPDTNKPRWRFTIQLQVRMSVRGA